MLLLRLGRLAEAEEAQRESIEIARRLFGEEHADVARGMRNLASILRAQGRLAEGEELCLRAIEAQRRLLGPAHPELARSQGELGRLRWARGNPDGAHSAFVEQGRVYEAARGRAGNAVDRATFQQSPYNALARVRLQQGRQREAWEAAERARARSLADLLHAGGRAGLPQSAPPPPRGRARAGRDPRRPGAGGAGGGDAGRGDAGG